MLYLEPFRYFHKSIVDYSKFSLKVTLTDKLRDLDDSTSGLVTDNEGKLFNIDTEDYEDVFVHATRTNDDSAVVRSSFTGAY